MEMRTKKALAAGLLGGMAGMTGHGVLTKRKPGQSRSGYESERNLYAGLAALLSAAATYYAESHGASGLGALADPLAAGRARVAELRCLPGYNEAMLQKFGAALPPAIYGEEMRRLRSRRADVVRQTPVAREQNLIREAVANNELALVDEFKRSRTTAAARRYLFEAELMKKSVSPLGYTTSGQHLGLG